MAQKPSAAKSLSKLKSLLDEFTAKQADVDLIPNPIFQRLLTGLKQNLLTLRKSQEKSANDFNLLDTLQISGDEVKHSMMLTWLLDHRIEQAGTHAQGNLGFQFFLKEIGLNENYAKTNYWVMREVCGEESRVDVEIAARGEFIIHIENKIYSEEGNDQTAREWRDLQRRAHELGVGQGKMHGIFLTLRGEKPINQNFSALSWKQVANVLDNFAKHAKAPHVSLFATHYVRALRQMMVEHLETNENEQPTKSQT